MDHTRAFLEWLTFLLGTRVGRLPDAAISPLSLDFEVGCLVSIHRSPSRCQRIVVVEPSGERYSVAF